MTKTTHSPADDYLRRFERAAHSLPRHERDELVGSIREHLDTAIAPDATEADIRNVLDALGEPAGIVAAAQPERVPIRRGAREVFALIFLVLPVVPILGWLAGVGLLVSSTLWTARQKMLGILVWPGGLSAALAALVIAAPAGGTRIVGPVCPVGPPSAAIGCTTTSTSTGGPGLATPIVAMIMIVLIVAPILVAAYLYRAAGRNTAAA